MRSIRPKIFVIFTFVLLLTGCVVLSSSEVTVKKTSNAPKGEKILTFLNPTPYLGEMTVALAEYGFKVRPMPSQERITKLKSPTKISEYNQASAPYGLTLQAQQTGFCAFTPHKIFIFTLMLTDINKNEILLVLKQKGSDGPCTTVEPVFGTLSKELSNNW